MWGENIRVAWGTLALEARQHAAVSDSDGTDMTASERTRALEARNHQVEDESEKGVLVADTEAAQGSSGGASAVVLADGYLV